MAEALLDWLPALLLALLETLETLDGEVPADAEAPPPPQALKDTASTVKATDNRRSDIAILIGVYGGAVRMAAIACLRKRLRDIVPDFMRRM